MSDFLLSLAICLLVSVMFAAIAAWLTTKRGNTISDVLQSERFKDANALKVEITDKIKLSSNVPIVALYVIAAVVGIALPMFMFYLTHKDVATITLAGTLVVDPAKEVWVIPKDVYIDKTGHFSTPVAYRDGLSYLAIQSPDYEPVTLELRINKQDNSITVTSNVAPQPTAVKIDQNGWVASLSVPIKLHPTSIPVVASDRNASMQERAKP